MARPRKRGLDYFPLDVDFFDDEKIFDVQNEYGPLGETVYLRLVCLIYRNGYYFKFDSIEKLAAMVIRSIGSRWVESRHEIVEIIEFMIECGLFSKRLAEMNILTSKGIQTRFKLATERRRSGIIEYNLIEEGSDFTKNIHADEGVCDISLYDAVDSSEENIHENVKAHDDFTVNDLIVQSIPDIEYNECTEEISGNSDIMYDYNMYELNDYFSKYANEDSVTNDTSENTDCTEDVSAYNNEGFCCNNPTKKSKVNKSKLKESKENESIFDTAAEKCSPPSTEKIVNIFNNVCRSLPKVTKITEERARAAEAAAAMINGDFEGLFRRVERSDFLTGRNGKWLNCSFDWIFKPCNLAKILNGNYDDSFETYGRRGSFCYSNKHENEDEYYESLKKLSPCY